MWFTLKGKKVSDHEESDTFVQSKMITLPKYDSYNVKHKVLSDDQTKMRGLRLSVFLSAVVTRTNAGIWYGATLPLFYQSDPDQQVTWQGTK